jgi:hypothetical protein
MLNQMISRVSQLWRVGLVGIALCAVPFYLSSQEGSPSQQAPSSAAQPFAGIDDSFAKAADFLLLPPAQTIHPVTGTTKIETFPALSYARHDDLRPQPWSESGPNAAAMRLNFLRPIVEPILMNRGVPADLAAVILVESSGRADALSPKGARGLWQLMPDTARRYGLRVDGIQDDRLDLFRATDAAARYLHDLYGQFGDWKLALAAYNTGEANVSSAIMKAHTQDFDQLASLRVLPLETRKYVPRVLIAALSIGRSSTLVENHRAVSAITVFAVSNH